MKNFMEVWFTNEPKELTVYWTCRNGKYTSTIRKDNDIRVIYSNSNCADMKSKTVALLKQFSGDTKLVWIKR